MLADQCRAALEAAPTVPVLDEAVKAVWRALAAGAITEAQAETLDLLATSKRALLAPKVTRGGPVSLGRSLGTLFPKRRPQRSPNRPRSIARRRHLAASGPMPPALASRWTTGQLAVFRIITDEVREHGACRLTLGAIAARAGVCRSLAQDAIRQAERECLLSVHRERPPGQRSRPNVIRIICREWGSWIARGPKGGGSKKTDPTATIGDQSGTEHAKRSRGRGCRRAAADPLRPSAPACASG